MKEFKGVTIQSTISDSAHSNSNELVDDVIDPKNDPLVATHTSDGNSATDTNNGNSPHKLLANREIPAIFQGVIPPVFQVTVDGVSICGVDLHAVRTVLSEEIVTGAATSAAHVFKDTPVVNWKFSSRPIPIDMNTVGVSSRATTQVLTGTGASSPPIRISIQNIGIENLH